MGAAATLVGVTTTAPTRMESNGLGGHCSLLLYRLGASAEPLHSEATFGMFEPDVWARNNTSVIAMFPDNLVGSAGWHVSDRAQPLQAAEVIPVCLHPEKPREESTSLSQPLQSYPKHMALERKREKWGRYYQQL